MSFPSRSDCHHTNPSIAHKQATESVKDVPHLESASIATDKPENVDLYLLLKKRSEQSLSDSQEKIGSGQSGSGTVVRKAVQE